MNNSDSQKSRTDNFLSRHSCKLGLTAIILAFVTAATLTWRKWPDVTIDFGTQLYIPWQILKGAVLYRDLFYFAGGPFSQYFNALLFKIFGVSFLTLIVANLTFVAGIIYLIYRRFMAAADVATATLICLAIVLVFAFEQFMQTGNYNYIAPYSHEALHGLILSILAIAFLSDWINKEKTHFALAAGFCVGVVFLTKPDIFAALALTVVAGFALFLMTRGRKIFIGSLAAFIFAGLLPPLFFFIYFLRVEDWRHSMRAVIFGWLPLFQKAIVENPYYLWCTGLDQPFFHLYLITTYFLAAVFLLVFYTLVLRHVEKVVIPLVIAPLLFGAAIFNWNQCGWVLPSLSLWVCILIGWNFKKIGRRPVFPFLWSVFSLVLLSKLGLFPRIWHYGFVLAMPAFVSVIFLLYWLLPMLLEKEFGVSTRRIRVTIALVFLIGFGNLFVQSQLIYSTKRLTLGQGGDKIITYNSDQDISHEFSAALAWTEINTPSNATVAVLPEGVTLNYLARRINPTPCLFWDPNIFSVFGQSNMTVTFEKNPPDYVFLVERNMFKFGVGSFGSYPGYGVQLMQWIDENYTPVELFGVEPVVNDLSAIKILKRISVSTPQNKN